MADVETTGCVVFPSNARTKLHAATAGAPVAFEVDGDELDDPEAVARVAAARVPLWAVGPYTHWLRIHPEHVSGRRISTLP